ncbi:MAG: hypothetical protein M1830_001403, partial [Pleopsidium flavum]
MAEALGAAGSIAGLIGLAGQIAQGVLFLHGFFNDIRDAPDEIRDLRVELDQYQRLYEGLEKLSQRFEPLGLTNNAFEDVEAALVPCKAWTDKLVRKISKYTLKDGPEGRRRRLWSQISVAIRKQRYREYLAALERAKSTLLAAQTSLNT